MNQDQRRRGGVSGESDARDRGERQVEPFHRTIHAGRSRQMGPAGRRRSVSDWIRKPILVSVFKTRQRGHAICGHTSCGWSDRSAAIDEKYDFNRRRQSGDPRRKLYARLVDPLQSFSRRSFRVAAPGLSRGRKKTAWMARTPVYVSCGRKSQATGRLIAQPGAGPAPGLAYIGWAVWRQKRLDQRRAHDRSPASGAYPVFSSSIGSDLSPERTIFPAARTWTKSGTM